MPNRTRCFENDEGLEVYMKILVRQIVCATKDFSAGRGFLFGAVAGYAIKCEKYLQLNCNETATKSLLNINYLE
jgi:hypothetical protein